MNSENNGTGPPCRRFLPPLFSKATLLILLLIWFVIACITASVLMNQNYHPNQTTTNWILMGGLTSSQVNFRIRNHADLGRLVVATDPSLEELVFEQDFTTNHNVTITPDGSSSSSSSNTLVYSITVTDLIPNTKYYYATTTNNNNDIHWQGQFKTAPLEGQAQNFQVVASACSWTGSESSIYTQMVDRHVLSDNDPNTLLMLHLGDFHYQDLNTPDIETRINAYDMVMTSSTQRNLWSNLPICNIWDDHDWLGNNLGGNTSEIGYTAAIESYNLAIPHYEPLSSSMSKNNSNVTNNDPQYGTNGVYQAFTIGTIRFILTDLRSERSNTEIYSSKQKEWLFTELENSSSYDFVVWMSSIPWIGHAKYGHDSWRGYAQDRQQLSQHIQQVVTKKNLLVISADAHMIAFDDGTNTYYGDDTNNSVENINNSTSANGTTATSPAFIRSFPILQTGPLDRLGSVKGGPYSDGCNTNLYERNHQYSVIEFQIEDRDRSPCLKIRSYDENDIILEKQLCGDIFGNSREYVDEIVGSCEASYLSVTNIVLISISAVILVIAMLLPFSIFKGYFEAILVSLFVLIFFGLTFGAGFFIPYAQGVKNYDAFEAILVSLLQIVSVSVYLGCWKLRGKRNAQSKEKSFVGHSGENNKESVGITVPAASAY